MAFVPASATCHRGVRAVLVAAVAVLTAAGCSQPFHWDEYAKDRCVSGVSSVAGSDSFYVSSAGMQSDNTVTVSGIWNVGAVDAAGRTVLAEDVPYGWTCVVIDPGTHPEAEYDVVITYDSSSTPPVDTSLPRAFGGVAETPPANIPPNPLAFGGAASAPAPAEAPPAAVVPDACVIKGNVSFNTGERIYHVPGQAFYDETVINEDYDERWFCTEDDALAAGWRKSRQ